MLADTMEIERLVFPLIGQPKFDGLRCTVLPSLGPVSRTLKSIPNRFVRDRLSEIEFLNHDGEIVTYTDGAMDDLGLVQSKIMTADGEPDFKYHTFDHVEVPSDPYELRHSRLVGGYIVENTILPDFAALMAFEEALVVDGWEGVILRKIGSPYKFGRSTAKEGTLLKMKRFYDDEATVIGFVEKQTNTNEQTRDERGYAKRSKAKAGMVPGGVLGALQMRWASGVEFELGSGFDAEQRQRIWDNQPEYAGRQVTFKYQRVGPNGAPLLPIFKCFRPELDKHEPL
jgi:DNA ligase-1